jgi:SAM-dependent methyltransferase
MEAAIQEDYIKLNLGCGSRFIDGWVNVDLVSRDSFNEEQKKKGLEPDVVSDIRKLPFDDNYADEAMAIHVVEHFYVWEVPDLLKEWIRVLKPGGRLIIEVPDLEKVFRYISEGMKHPTFTMWPLYGDPSHRDPLMGHKWGYTPQSLAKMMAHVGLETLERHPAQFHLKEERDMRIIGFKHGD